MNAAERLGQFVLFELGALPYAFLTAQPTWRTHGARLAELTRVRSGQRLLDVGCGPGESAFGMAERVPGLRVTGLDFSRAMLRIAEARKRFDPVGASVELTKGNALDLSFADGSFDAVTGHSFLYLVPDAVRALSEARRVMRPGARCAFLEPARVPDSPLLPASMREQALHDPRFVASMALWRLVSRRYGRFDVARFERAFEAAGLRPIEIVPTLEGLGIFGVAERPKLASLDDIDWTRWTPTDKATLLFVVRDGQILLIRKKRGLGAGKVNGPGGRLEPGESTRACAIREVEEELRVTPTGVAEMGRLRFQFQDGYALEAHVFRADGCIGTATETDEATPLWTPLDRIPFGEMWADDALWLPLMLEGKRIDGRFVFDGEAMLAHALD